MQPLHIFLPSLNDATALQNHFPSEDGYLAWPQRALLQAVAKAQRAALEARHEGKASPFLIGGHGFGIKFCGQLRRCSSLLGPYRTDLGQLEWALD